jgi:hypothetical protein
MIQSLRRTLALILVGCWSFLSLSHFGLAQGVNKQDVSFTTADGVKLMGTYYPGNKGNNSPTALILHEWGKDRNKGDWGGLAEQLQKSGFAVLTFDFRGHGQSTEVSDKQTFWSYPTNRSYIRAGKDLGSFSYKDISNLAYTPMLINDIAAARRFLDLKNDANDCNVSNLFIMGAKEGAGLGMAWVAMEWKRNISLVPGQPQFAGQDIAGCVWLSIDRAPNRVTLPLKNLVLAAPVLREKTPMLFLYGEQETSKGDSAIAYDIMKTTGKAADLNKQTFLRAVPKAKLSGVGLLGQQAFGTEKTIDDYVTALVQVRGGSVWFNRETTKFRVEMLPLRAYGFSIQ